MTFEETIQKSKRRLKNRFITKCVLIGLVFVMWISYFFFPCAKVYNSEIIGNHYLTSDEVLSYAGLEKSNSLYLISKSKIKNKLDENPLFENAKVSISPFGLKIEFDEIVPVFSYDNNYYNTNMTKLDSSLINDEVIGEKIHEIIQEDPSTKKSQIVTLINEPGSDKFDRLRYDTLSSTMISLSENERKKIEFVGFSSDEYTYDFYYLVSENHLLKYSVLDSPIVSSEYLTGAVIEKSINAILEQYTLVKDDLKTSTIEIESNEYQMEQFKVIVKEEKNSPYYSLVPVKNEA